MSSKGLTCQTCRSKQYGALELAEPKIDPTVAGSVGIVGHAFLPSTIVSAKGPHSPSCAGTGIQRLSRMGRVLRWPVQARQMVTDKRSPRMRFYTGELGDRKGRLTIHNLLAGYCTNSVALRQTQTRCSPEGGSGRIGRITSNSPFDVVQCLVCRSTRGCERPQLKQVFPAKDGDLVL